MRDVVSLIDNEQDFDNYVIELSARVPPQMRNMEVKYERHPSLALIQQPSEAMSTTNNSFVSTHQTPGPSGFAQQGHHLLPQSQGFGAVVQAPAMIPMQPTQQMPVQTQYAGSNYNNMDYPRMRPVFGQSLEALLARDESVVPILVLQCIQAVDLYGLEVEGIYRLSGDKKHVERIKQIFDNGRGLLCRSWIESVVAYLALNRSFHYRLPQTRGFLLRRQQRRQHSQTILPRPPRSAPHQRPLQQIHQRLAHRR